MKRVISTLLCAALLLTVATACGNGAAATGGGDGGIGGTLVLYSSMTDNDLDNLVAGFAAVHPNVNIEIVNGSAGELTARIRAEAANPQADVMWGGLNIADGDMHSDIFEHWLTEFEGQLPESYRSPNGFYSMTHLSTIVLCVNTELEAELGMNITGYADLLDPRLFGRIVMPDPNSSSSAWNNLSNILTVFGQESEEAWEYIDEFLANGVVITSSSSVAFRGVADGEYVVGLTYEDGAATLLKAGATNIRMVYPEEGASAFAFGAAVVRGARNPEAAQALVNWLMSPEGQTYMGNALGTLRFTNPNAEYVSPYLPYDHEIYWVSRDIPWLTENRPAILERWNEIFMRHN